MILFNCRRSLKLENDMHVRAICSCIILIRCWFFTSFYVFFFCSQHEWKESLTVQNRKAKTQSTEIGFWRPNNVRYVCSSSQIMVSQSSPSTKIVDNIPQYFGHFFVYNSEKSLINTHSGWRGVGVRGVFLVESRYNARCRKEVTARHSITVRSFFSSLLMLFFIC